MSVNSHFCRTVFELLQSKTKAEGLRGPRRSGLFFESQSKARKVLVTALSKTKSRQKILTLKYRTIKCIGR